APVDHERPPPPPRRLDGGTEPEHAAAYHDEIEPLVCHGLSARPFLGFTARRKLLCGDQDGLAVTPDDQRQAGPPILLDRVCGRALEGPLNRFLFQEYLSDSAQFATRHD